MVTQSKKKSNRASKAVPKKTMKYATAKKPAPMRTPALKAIKLAGVFKETRQAVPATETPAEMRPLTFVLAPGATAKHISVTIRSTKSDPEPDQEVMANSKSLPSQPRPKGRRLKLEIQIVGNPGDAATINVANGTPATIAVEVPADTGKTSWIHNSFVKADWP